MTEFIEQQIKKDVTVIKFMRFYIQTLIKRLSKNSYTI